MANGSGSVNCFITCTPRSLTAADAGGKGGGMIRLPVFALIAAVLTLPVAAPVAAYVPTAEDKLYALTPTDFQLSARTRTEGASVTIDTGRGFIESHGLMAGDSDDNYLRAVIDPASGGVRYQAVQTVTYKGGWRYFHQAEFDGGGGKLDIIVREVAGCYGSKTSSCTLREAVAFDIPEAALRALAASYRPRSRTSWPYRLKATANADFDGRFAPAEAAGLLLAVDKWVAKRRER